MCWNTTRASSPEAIRKELARGGQVYYLHNRVDTIDECAARIGKLMPGARIGIAHGKMTEEQISSVWQQLLDNEIDVLGLHHADRDRRRRAQLQHADH